MGSHLQKTASSISLVKEKLHGSGDGGGGGRAHNKGDLSIPTTANPTLSDYNQQIDAALKDLASKTGGKTKVEEKLRKYLSIMGDVEGALKAVPKSLKDVTGKKKTKMPKGTDKKLAENVNAKTLDLIHRMRHAEPKKEFKGFSTQISDGEDEKEIGEWIKYEGFNSKEDLDRYNEMCKKYVGETPEEHAMKQQKKKKDFHLDEKGKLAIDKKILDRPPPKLKLYSAYERTSGEEKVLKTCQDAEVRLRQVLSRKPATGAGDGASAASVLSEKKFLDDFLGQKLKGSQDPNAKSKKIDKKRLYPEAKRTSPGISSSLFGLQSYLKKHTEDVDKKERMRSLEDTTPPESKEPSTTSIKAGESTSEVDKLFDLPRPNQFDPLPKVSGDSPPVECSVKYDLDRIKKLIVKEKKEQLRKKREDWERNNELSEGMIEREEMRKLMKSLPQARENPFEVSAARNMPNPADFLTQQKEHDKMYRKAVEGMEGTFHKEDLAYKFGVNPFYRTKKEEREEDESKPVFMKKYTGVRKKKEPSSKSSELDKTGSTVQ